MGGGAGARGETGKEEERSDMSVLIDAERCTGGGTMVAAAGMSTSLLKT